MAERSYLGWLAGLALGGVALDQVTKYGVFRWLYHDGLGGAHEVWPGVFRLLAQFDPSAPAPEGPLAGLQTVSGSVPPRVNHGALFGLANHHEGLANTVFAVVSVLAAVAIVAWACRRSTARDGLLCTALGLILGGTVGNLYDRVVFGGVRDFLHFYWFEWPVFNVADCCLVCGAILLLAQAIWAKPAAEPAPQPESAAAPTAAVNQAG
jgi:signal peptidase II